MVRIGAITAVAVSLWLGIGVAAAEKEAEGEVQKHSFRVVKNVLANSVGFDREGRCAPAGNRQLQSWRVPDFPAQIPPFESCATISSKTARGMVDFTMRIVDKEKKTIKRVEGAIDLGIDGQASQAINWEHLEIPTPGTYYLVIEVEEREIGRFPLRFERRTKSAR